VRITEPRPRALPDRFLTPKDLAEMLGIPIQTVYQWRYLRVGPPGFRVGRHLRYDPRAVLLWIDQLTEGTT
jgi:predicted DNA-binding transcriptional regulator AlpA